MSPSPLSEGHLCFCSIFSKAQWHFPVYSGDCALQTCNIRVLIHHLKELVYDAGCGQKVILTMFIFQILTALFLFPVKGEKKRHGAGQNVVIAQHYVCQPTQTYSSVSQETAWQFRLGLQYEQNLTQPVSQPADEALRAHTHIYSKIHSQMCRMAETIRKDKQPLKINW